MHEDVPAPDLSQKDALSSIILFNSPKNCSLGYRTGSERSSTAAPLPLGEKCGLRLSYIELSKLLVVALFNIELRENRSRRIGRGFIDWLIFAHRN